ncbi:hypothetical protein [Aeromicrobium sp. UC242_57]|uniref:hypothetical protein n=1 Tax=Aeromicrobium sp. UC242_57 TaxID=3374624 RepID=UPI0037AF4DCB
MAVGRSISGQSGHEDLVGLPVGHPQDAFASQTADRRSADVGRVVDRQPHLDPVDAQRRERVVGRQAQSARDQEGLLEPRVPPDRGDVGLLVLDRHGADALTGQHDREPGELRRS